MHIRKLTAALLALVVVALVISLALPHWECGNLLEHCIEEGADNRDALISVASLLVIGTVLLFFVFVIDVVLLCKSQVPAGSITARFILLYFGAAAVFVAVVVYTAVVVGRWAYFMAVVGASIAFVVHKLAVISCRCVSADDI